MPKPTAKSKATTATLCACCKEVPHNFIPDRDLDAYVCSDCQPYLLSAEVRLNLAGYAGCTQEGS